MWLHPVAGKQRMHKNVREFASLIAPASSYVCQAADQSTGRNTGRRTALCPLRQGGTCQPVNLTGLLFGCFQQVRRSDLWCGVFLQLSG